MEFFFCFCFLVFFFFQAEDGIRDDLVTGVQTCALPIWDLREYREIRELRVCSHIYSHVVRSCDQDPLIMLWEIIIHTAPICYILMLNSDVTL